jgi:Ca2+-binding RTX toxin-like protein
LAFQNVETFDALDGSDTASIAQLASFDNIIASEADPDARFAFSLQGGGGTLDLTTKIAGLHSVVLVAAGLTSAADITGSVNDDGIFGGSFDDTLNGGTGDDTLGGSAGDDTMIGGVGNDTYYVDVVGDQVVELAGEGTDTIYSSINYTLGEDENVEALRGYGGGLEGLRLAGNSHANLIGGGGSNDLLTGGAGNDTFFFDDFASADIIADFVAGGDTIQLNSAEFAGLALGQLAAAGFSTGAATGTGPQILYDRASGWLSYDSDGAGSVAAKHFASLSGSPDLGASDINIV